MSVGFNDPEAWGYCECCAFMVAKNVETGNLLGHEISSLNSEVCNGSYWPADPTPEKSAAPKPHHRYKKKPPGEGSCVFIPEVVDEHEEVGRPVGSADGGGDQL